MAESSRTRDLLAILESQQSSKLQKLIALGKLTELCEDGFSAGDLELMLKTISTIKGITLAVQLLDCCLPAADVSPAALDRAVFVMARPHTSPALKRALLGWMLAGVQYFLPPAGRRYLHTHYGPIFDQAALGQMVNLACTLLYQMTEQSDVQPHRVDMLLSNTSTAADSGPRWALIRKYRQLRPDLAQRHSGLEGPPRWEKPRSQLAANVARWRQRRGVPASAAGGDGGGDLWEMTGKSSRRAPALPVLPESLPPPGGGAPDPWHGCRDLASLASAQDVAAEGALGFRAANNLTALALSREGRAALLLSDTGEKDATKINMDLLITLRQMLVFDPRRYPAPRRRQLIRQLQLCQRVNLPLSAARYLMSAVLARARPELSALWLPALDLLPFYGWRPHEVTQTVLLRPLEKLVAAADRHARLHVLHVLTEFVLQLARRELPLVRRRAFPYTSDICRDEIGSSIDPALEVARVTEHVAGLCKRLSAAAPPAERLNLLRATVHFYTEVTPALLSAGVPYMPLMGKDLVYQVVQGADPLALHKLLLLFSRYREQASTLVEMQSTPSRLPRALVKLAGATADRLQALTPIMEDLLRALFGVRKGSGGQFGDLAPEVRARLKAMVKGLRLDGHPALLSYQAAAERTAEYKEASSHLELVEDLLAADGLVGFTAYREACAGPARRRHRRH